MKKYLVRTYSRGMNIPSEEEFDNKKDAYKFYNEYVNLYGGDVECHLIKMKTIEFSPYYVDCD